VSENAPRKLTATDLGAPAGTKFVHAACGRGHSLLVGSNGHVWTAGMNNMGQVSFFWFLLNPRFHGFG
jgi:alpha-tubulin suppressor-like RCC1 family protein